MAFKIFFRPNIELKDVSIRYNENQTDGDVDYWSSDIGASVFLFFNKPGDEKGGIVIDNNYVIKLKIYNNKFYPYIDLTFKDPNDIVGNQLHPDDDTVISLFKKSDSKLIMPIRMDFVITKFRIIKEIESSGVKVYSLRAEMRLNDNSTDNLAFKGTSFAVLQQLAKKLEMGFASNIDDTDDYMTWINPGNYITEFIPDIVKNSYRSDDGFLWTFIDLYYNLNYIDVEQQLSLNTEEQKNVWNTNMFLEGKDSITRLLLTNHPNMKGSNMFIDKFIIDNSAREVNWGIGYDAQVYYYDKTENSAINYQLDTISNPGRDADKIILKSLDKSTNTRKYYMGKLDEDNVHKNFLFARKQNENNIEFLQKIKMNIILTSSNMSLYRLQHVELILYELENLANENLLGEEAKSDSYRINEKLSGSWLITGINYVFEKFKIYQEITLVKRELNIEYDKKKLDDMTKAFYSYSK